MGERALAGRIAPHQRFLRTEQLRHIDALDECRKYRHPVGPDCRVDETYARIRGHWHCVYRAIHGYGQIVDACVSPTRDMVATRRFFERAIASSGTTPHRVITDKAATCPRAMAVAVPGVLQRTGRYLQTASTASTGFPKNGRGQCMGHV